MFTHNTIGGPCLKCGRPNIEHGDGVCPTDAQYPRQQQARFMRPTAYLRFVERTLVPGADGVERKVRVLQQQWTPVHGGHCEWRDVPMGTEEAAQIGCSPT